MSRRQIWVIDDYRYRRLSRESLVREYPLAAVLHTHSYHSEEDLAPLNDVMALPVLRRFNGIFRRVFKTKAKEALDYSNLYYCPPISPREVYELELASARELGFEEILMAVTDHDKIAGCLELLDERPDLEPLTTVGEELSVPYEGDEFHLGVFGIRRDGAEQLHARLQELAGRGALDDLFELLDERGCLVVLNHPLYNMRRAGNHLILLRRLLGRYGWAIHALEFNGLRRPEENDAVVALARQFGKPVVGGGDRHSPIPSVVLAAAREAATFDDYLEEVKRGGGVTVCKPDYFQPHAWKMFVRILFYVAAYRRITFYKDTPITSFALDDRIVPDYFAGVAGFLLKTLSALRLVR